MPIRGLVASVALMAATSACAASPVVARETFSRQPVETQPSGLHASASALAGHGELAVVSSHRLMLLGGPVSKLRRVVLPGRATDPIWSHDGRWLAVRTSQAPPKSSPYDEEPKTLWLLNASGQVVRRLTAKGLDTTAAQWSPTSDRLVIATSKDGSSAHDARVVVKDVSGHGRTLVSSFEVAGVAWSPDGGRIAVSVNGFGKHWNSRLRVYPEVGGAGRTVTSSKGNVLDLAGWWPDGSGLLAWLDFMGSGSLAADGLPLVEVPLATGKQHRIVKTMLQHQSWIADSASHNEIAVVEGGDRELTMGHKAVAICTTTRCSRITQPGKQVSFDPGWSPAGQLSVVRDHAVAPTHGFGTSYINRIQRSGGVRIVRPSGSSLAGVGSDVTAPIWGQGGSLIALHGRDVVLLTPGAHTAKRVVGPISLDLNSTYYGFVPWLASIAWSDAEPAGLAGTD
jgi:hypothetical protein